MPRNVTTIADLINPQVMADMINGKIEKMIVVTPFAKIDTTLEGRSGNTITVPKYSYIGDAEDVAEGVACGTTKLEAGTTTATVKKSMKAVELTDEALLSGYGDPMGESTSQLAKAIASKTDADCMVELTDLDKVQLIYKDTANKIKYANIVEAIDLFGEEVQSEKVMFINPTQVTTLRKDPDFVSADKYKNDVIMRGEIGMICGTRIVPSKRVVKNPAISATYALLTSAPSDWSTNYTHYFTKNGNTYSAVTGDSAPVFATDTYYEKKTDAINANTVWMNPIVKLNNEAEAEDDAPAMTIYMKKETTVETERDTLARKTIVSADKHYCVALSNTSKVVLALLKA